MKLRRIDVRDVGAVSIPDLSGLSREHANEPRAFKQNKRPDESAQALTYKGAWLADATMQQARALLLRVIARLPHRTPRAVQFLSFDGLYGGEVTSAFCRAAAEQVGPVLQAEPAMADVNGPALDERIYPDVVFPRLAHMRLAIKPMDLIGRGRSALLREGESEVELAAYEMIVVEFRCNLDSLESAQIASAFGGTVLVAGAGLTTRQQLLAANHAVQTAGGLVLGVALAQVPPRPSWLKWLAPV